MAELTAELQEHVEDVEGLGRCLRHPLVFCVPYLPGFEEHLNKSLTVKKAACLKALRQKKYGSYAFLHERPYRLHAFSDIRDRMTPAEQADVLHQIWIDTEAPHINASLWRTFFSLCDADAFMDEEDRPTLDALPQRVTIYRGGDPEGLSWTLSKEKAQWFAKRFGEERPLQTCTVQKEDIFAYTNGRNEQEVIILNPLALNPADDA